MSAKAIPSCFKPSTPTYAFIFPFKSKKTEKKKLEDDYKKITSPTRMQYARYRNGLSDVYSNVYSKAKDYLQRVLQLFPSTEAGNTLEKIRKLEAEIK